MATRSAKGKKAADVKVTEDAPVKKGRKGKQAIEPDTPEMEIDEQTAVPEKKSKRGKKIASQEEQVNGTNEEVGPPIKKSRKKNVEEPTHEEQSNGDNSAAEQEPTPADEVEQDDDQTETNGHTEAPQGSSGGKGRKKQTKKDTAAEKSSGLETKTKETGRGRKNTKQDNEESDTVKKSDIAEDKSKPTGRGRGKKAQAKPSDDLEVEEKVEGPEEAKPEPSASKGRKKQTKANKEKTPEVDKEISENPEQKEEEEEENDKSEEEPKKKETKSRKNQGKKVSPKEDPEEKDEEIKEELQPVKKRRGAKKEEKSKGDSKDEEEEETGSEEKAPEAKPTKGKRGQKNAPTKPIETEEEVQDTGEVTNKRRRKPAEEKAADEGKKKAPLKNKFSTNYEEIDFSNASKTTQGKEWNLKIASWNVDGIRAWLEKGGLDYLKYEKPNILCLQEIKCPLEKLPQEVTNVPGYHAYWLCSDQDGYAGVGIYTTKLAMNVQYGLQNEELDSEGRIITAEYEQFYLVCTYVPNAGRKLITLPKRLKWNEEFRKYVKSLDMKKPVIICGDMNVSHNEIDLANPKTNKKNAGFTEEERTGMTELLSDGFVDTYRQLYPQKANAYTFWTYMMNCRAKNVGWRLDYFIMSQRLLPSLCDSVIRNEVYGSDHCPITMFLHLSSADKPKE